MVVKSSLDFSSIPMDTRWGLGLARWPWDCPDPEALVRARLVPARNEEVSDNQQDMNPLLRLLVLDSLFSDEPTHPKAIATLLYQP